MQHFYALLIGLVLVAALVSGCAHSPEVRVSGQHEITFQYRR